MGRKKKTNEQFLLELNKKFPNKLTPLEEYKGNRSSILFRCNDCGTVFKSMPMFLLSESKYGCPTCFADAKRKSLDEFIQKAKEIHGNKYDYSKVIYNGAFCKIKIICPIHGEFEQRASAHLGGQGCPKCRDDDKKKSLDEFIQKAKEIHGNKYDYSKVIYNNGYKDKIEIVCPKHGSFFQLASAHLTGQGCPKCRESRGEIKTEKILKENNIEYVWHYCFPDCKYDKELEFDFYLPELNTVIEYQGRQHFEIIEAWETEKENFTVRQKRDIAKKEFCNRNKIKLVEIRFDEDIKEKLIQEGIIK